MLAGFINSMFCIISSVQTQLPKAAVYNFPGSRCLEKNGSRSHQERWLDGGFKDFVCPYLGKIPCYASVWDKCVFLKLYPGSPLHYLGVRMLSHSWNKRNWWFPLLVPSILGTTVGIFSKRRVHSQTPVSKDSQIVDVWNCTKNQSWWNWQYPISQT